MNLNFEILVYGQGVWGKGKTITEAMKNAGKPKWYIVYFAPAGAYVNEYGGIVSPNPTFGIVEIESKLEKVKFKRAK